MSQYEVLALGNSPKEFESKHGPMVNYQVELQDDKGTRQWVQLVQKLNSPEPKTGDKLDGSIEPTDYGPRFKKDFQAGKPSYGGGGKSTDSYAMYVSYAKDLALGLLPSFTKESEYSSDRLAEVVADVAKAAEALWNSRPT